MRKSSCTVIAALAVWALSAAGAEAAVLRVPDLPGEVTATECIQGGGVIIISADGDGTGSFTTLCRGGIHDGQTVT
ncbi:hypothetical protein ACFWQ6_27350 [Streptomyces coelicoflavus]|uniref:hypothetical protein n=1 Tax=Streptomyces TaxID=1883 RepID=UPI0012916B8F|nr:MULTISPECIES: hypothetical protein [Streptomyces]KAF2775648.1 putative secreted protein [Streptomyces sp. OM5714]MCX5041149.1 hypothetical protein [Streptomyces coelicoflavus]MDI6516464.1 hypothetical protein [Streptomyces coelicoflavus]QFX79810.1 hypothetical protein GEV49_01880 [Streptomyces sp. SYP-A7193]